jgi:hypothetical protein
MLSLQRQNKEELYFAPDIAALSVSKYVPALNFGGNNAQI